MAAVTKLDYEPGFEIVERRGLVSADRIVNPSIIGETFGRVDDFLGGSKGMFGVWPRAASRVRELLLEDLSAEADKLGANLVVSADFRYGLVDEKGMLLFSAEGVAVVARRAKPRE